MQEKIIRKLENLLEAKLQRMKTQDDGRSPRQEGTTYQPSLLHFRVSVPFRHLIMGYRLPPGTELDKPCVHHRSDWAFLPSPLQTRHHGASRGVPLSTHSRRRSGSCTPRTNGCAKWPARRARWCLPLSPTESKLWKNSSLSSPGRRPRRSARCACASTSWRTGLRGTG